MSLLYTCALIFSIFCAYPTHFVQLLTFGGDTGHSQTFEGVGKRYFRTWSLSIRLDLICRVTNQVLGISQLILNE